MADDIGVKVRAFRGFCFKSERSLLGFPAGRDAGQSLVEFALVLPIFLAVFLGIVDFGWAFKSYISLTNSVREGARHAIVCPLTDDAIKDSVVFYAPGLGLTRADVTVTWEDAATRCATAKYVDVSASYNYQFISPLGDVLNFVTGGEIPNHLPMASSTKMRVE